MPFVFILASVFSCRQGFDQNYDSEISFNETFNTFSCFKACGTEYFWIQTALSITCLLIVIPLDALTRPHWQIIDIDLHFKSKPLSIIMKAVFQVMVVSVNLTLKEEAPLVHAITVLIFSAIYCFSYTMLWPWNYERLNWQFLLLYVSYVFWNIIALAS